MFWGIGALPQQAKNPSTEELAVDGFMHYGAPYALLASFLNPRIYIFFSKMHHYACVHFSKWNRLQFVAEPPLQIIFFPIIVEISLKIILIFILNHVIWNFF